MRARPLPCRGPRPGPWLAWLALAAAVSGCGGERAPFAPGPDPHGRDASLVPDGDAASPGRGPEPLLPPADLEVVLPFGDPPARHELEVAADLGRLDVHFSVDTTGSFGEEIDAMQAALDAGIVPALEARVADVAFGVSRFEDFPTPPFGAPSDAPYRLLSPITTSRSRISSAFALLDSPLGAGGDIPESGAEALFQVATGEGYRRAGTTYAEPFSGRAAPGGGVAGGVGFRVGALRAVVHVTDAPPHAPSDYGDLFPGTRGVDEAAAALGAVGARVLGVASGASARPHLEALALATGATVAPRADGCATGVDGALRSPARGVCPLVFDVRPDGSGLSSTIVDALVELLDAVRFEEVWGAAIDDRLGFVRSIEAARAQPPPGIEDPYRADLRPAGDGIDDTFLGVRRGTRMVFRLSLQNLTVPAADYDQHFRIGVQIVGDGLTLASRIVRVVVPRGREGRHDGGGPDAASPDAGRGDGGPEDAAAPDGDLDAGPP